MNFLIRRHVRQKKCLELNNVKFKAMIAFFQFEFQTFDLNPWARALYAPSKIFQNIDPKFEASQSSSQSDPRCN